MDLTGSWFDRSEIAGSWFSVKSEETEPWVGLPEVVAVWSGRSEMLDECVVLSDVKAKCTGRSDTEVP